MDPTTIAAASLAIGGATAYGSYQQARQRQSAIEASMESQRRAAETRMAQTQESAALEKQKNRNEAHLIRSRLRAAAGENIGFGGTFEALNRQADYDEYMNRQIIERNTEMMLDRIQSDAAANLTQLSSGIDRNPLLTAGLGGLQAGMGVMNVGLGIDSALQQADQRKPRTSKE